ncbi:MAG: hypothetical protein P4L44_10035 [Oryzomonas sp.]|uniref:hypothetical protein n=1 Tax=Oryzomonas sp. TaxID=2855186 RepID=UPI00284B6B13|nr:hypothetical protein [Oryzomonas sp.]MDR3580289.1 hypothetical protein [Oryzomonas sp.]
MSSSGKIRLLSMSALIIPGLIVFAWLIASIISRSSFFESMLIFVTQSFLTVIIFAVLIKTLPRQQSADGPRLIFIFALHVFTFYSISNIVPSLLPELRPENLLVRIPKSSTWAYGVATVAAALMLLGVAAGSRLALFLWPKARFRRAKPYAWLPDYKLAVIACLATVTLIIVGTSQYGVQVAAEMIKNEDVASMNLGEQLLFHGIFKVLPIAPLLAAAGYVKADTRGQQRLARFLLVSASVLTVLVLFIWGQRSTAMIALAMPLGLLINAKKINLRKTLLPIIVLMVLIYSTVTVMRNSDLLRLLVLTPDISQLSMSEVVSAITTKQGDKSVANRALADASYRTAGLEAAASLIQEQFEGRLALQWGNTVLGGFQQALPVSLRPESEVMTRIKTAPAYFGIFQSGDWVSTILAEFILDFGPLFLFFPAVVCGAVLTLIDLTLLGLGQYSPLGGILILRIMYLLSISNDGSFADWSIMFFKATIGYTSILLLLSILLWVSLKLKKNIKVMTQRRSFSPDDVRRLN